MAEQSPSGSDSQVRLAGATPLAISNERTDERTTDASDDCAIPELSDVRARVQDFNKVDGSTAYDWEPRFWAKVNKTDTCWLWTAAIRKDGYGAFNLFQRIHCPHRVSWFIANGRWPAKGMHIDHLCRVRHCVNPEHLEEVTPRENTIRGVGPERTRAMKLAITECPAGHPYDEENTLVSPTTGARRCRTCKLAAQTRSRAENPEHHRAMARAYAAKRRAAS